MARPAQKATSPPPGRTIVRELIQIVDNMEQHLLHTPTQRGRRGISGETLNADWVGRSPRASQRAWDGLIASRDSWDLFVWVSQMQMGDETRYLQDTTAK